MSSSLILLCLTYTFFHKNEKNKIKRQQLQDGGVLWIKIIERKFFFGRKKQRRHCKLYLASLGLSQSLNFAIHYCPPVDLVPFVEADCQGMYLFFLG